MADKILSVVVPTYNMEAYLPRCLDSVTRKNIPDTLEVIVVNDGSKDRSLEIAKEYQAKRPDIIQIIDKPNGHYGSCINAALKVATGKYFRPLDADDWFDTDALITFLKELENTDADLTLTSFRCIRKTKDIVYSSKNANFNKEYSPEDEFIWKSQCAMFLSMQATTYKLCVLKEAKLCLTEGINYTDSEFIFYPLQHTKTIVFFDLCLYNYDLTRDGQSMNPVVAAQNHSQLAQIIERIFAFRVPATFLETRILCCILVNYYYRMLFSFGNDDKELKQIDTKVRKASTTLQKMFNRSMFYAPVLWRMFGIHFYWYATLKQKLNIDR